MEPISHIIEAPHEGYEARPNSEDSNQYNFSKSKKYGKVRHSDMIEKLRSNYSRATNSDGFLSLSHIDWENKSCERGHPVVNGRCVNCGLERSY